MNNEQFLPTVWDPNRSCHQCLGIQVFAWVNYKLSNRAPNNPCIRISFPVEKKGSNFTINSEAELLVSKLLWNFW